MTRVYGDFVGCKVSQADCEAALAQLAAAGLEPVARRELADVCVLLTCAVTAEAERKSRRAARRLAAGGRRVLVAGCAARLRAAQFEHPGVEVVDGDWGAVAARFAADAPATHPVGGGEAVPARAGEDGRDGAADVAAGRGGRSAAATRTRFVLKVQDGCAGRCSYCVVRLVRGRPRSLPLAEAVAAAADAVARGCGEVVLSGVDLSAYRDPAARGSAPGGGADLADLVGALADLPGLLRLRLSSLEPHAVDDRLLGALAHPTVARHVHLPLQSADDGVLAAMGRRYTVRGYMGVAERVRERLDGAMLSTDVLVGFPAEDDAAFARTLAVLDGDLFGRVHVFAYSPRPGTVAARLASLPVHVVRARAAAAGERARTAQRRTALAMLGRRAEVLVEQRRGGRWRGYSSEYVRYELTGPARPGRLVAARGVAVDGDVVRGNVETPTPEAA